MPNKSAISQARIRLDSEVMKLIADEVLKPIAPPEFAGAWYRGMRIMAIDESCFEVPDVTDEQANIKFLKKKVFVDFSSFPEYPWPSHNHAHLGFQAYKNTIAETPISEKPDFNLLKLLNKISQSFKLRIFRERHSLCLIFHIKVYIKVNNQRHVLFCHYILEFPSKFFHPMGWQNLYQK